MKGSVVSGSAPRLSEWEMPESVRRGLFLLALLWMALVSVAFGLAGAVRDMDVWLLLAVAAVGALTGWVLATVRLPGWLVGVMVFVFGVVVVLVRVGRLGGDLAAVLKGAFSLYWSVWRWLLHGPSPNWSPLLLALMELRIGAATLFTRWSGWTWALLSGNPAFDPVATALVWGLAAWAVAAWAGWKVRRHQPLLALVPAIALLVATLQYVGAKPFSLLLPLGVALLLMALAQHDAREHRWRAARIKFSHDIWGDLTVKAALLSLALIIMATWVSSISIQKIIESGRRLAGERTDEGSAVAESLGVDQRPAPVKKTVFDATRVGGLPRRHLIGSGAELAEQLVLTVATSDPPSDAPRRYYWRSLTYDYYYAHGWYTGDTVEAEYDAGQPVMTTTVPFHRVVRQEVEIVGDVGDLVYVVGTVLAVDRDYTVAWRPPNDAFGATIEFRGADVYRADSLVPVVSEEQLLAAGTDYPEWIESRYLSLPDAIPQRVLSLARDLTATEPTPYERARAIEAYLRTFPYNLDVSAPPYGQDTVDYFLFDLQEGYCDYFSSAMVVLARAAGLPARLVIGYATGEYDPESARYIVTADQAHAWTEVYFPSYGWVEFEPTSGFPLIQRSAETVLSGWSEPEGVLEPAATSWDVLGWPLGRGILAVLSLLVLGGVGWMGVDSWRLRHREPTTVVAMLYERLQRHGRRLVVPIQPGDTPYEFAASLAEWVAEWAQGMWRGGDVSLVIHDAHSLVRLYVQASYSSCPLDDSDRARALQAWWRLRQWLWLAWVRRTRMGGILGSE
jgi:transglutaminase-like putative cysteine protease